MNEQELQQAFIQYLAQKTGAKNQQELEAVIQQMGEEGLKQAYAEFMQQMQQQQVRAAKFGAKLNYIKQLRGQCPDGYEVEYFKDGGGITRKKCKACEQKAQEVKEPSNPIDAFKCGRKTKKKENGGSVEMDKCGGKTKKKACGGSVEKNQQGNRVTLKKETSTGEPYERTTVRKWSDGTTSRREVSEGGDAYIGRRGEVGITNVPNDRQNAIADSLMRADWRTKTAPKLKPRIKK